MNPLVCLCIRCPATEFIVQVDNPIRYLFFKTVFMSLYKIRNIPSVYMIYRAEENAVQVCLVGVLLSSAARWCSE